MASIWYHGPTKVYRLYDADGELLYVGVTLGTLIRFREHEATWEWWSEVDGWTTAHYATRREALAAEREAIEAEKPRYNVQYNEGNPDRVKPKMKKHIRSRGTCPRCGGNFAYNPAPTYGNYPPAMVYHYRVETDADDVLTHYGRCEGTSMPPMEYMEVFA